MAIKESPSASIAAEESQIAKAVLMPGDPLRAKYVADHYLDSAIWSPWNKRCEEAVEKRTKANSPP